MCRKQKDGRKKFILDKMREKGKGWWGGTGLLNGGSGEGEKNKEKKGKRSGKTGKEKKPVGGPNLEGGGKRRGGDVFQKELGRGKAKGVGGLRGRKCKIKGKNRKTGPKPVACCRGKSTSRGVKARKTSEGKKKKKKRGVAEK